MKHIPNILSAFRIILVPIFVSMFLQGNTAVAGILIIISGLTDFLDGYLARRNNWVSRLGKFLDPAADKLTQIAIYIIFIINFPQFRIFFVLLLIKEILMLLGGAVLFKRKSPFKGARWCGKIVTILFYVTAISMTLFPSMPAQLQSVLVIATTVMAIIALVLYIPDLKAAKKDKH